MFCHMLQYGKGTFVLLPNSNWQTINATYSYDYICYVNGSQLAKLKEYFWHVPAMKCLGMKQLV